MHIKKNAFDKFFNNAVDIKGKIKDNVNARMDFEGTLQVKRLGICGV